MDRSAAESLLAAQSLRRGDGPDATPDVLVNLLTAAAAPPRPYELDGEEAAVIAFRQARSAPVPTPGHRSLLARLLTVKVAAAFALTTVGGVAVAAASGFTELPGASGLGPRPAAPSDTPSTTPPTASSTPASAAPVPSIRPTPSPHPSPENLCQILLADPRNGPAGTEIKGLDPQTLATLIALAGGKAELWSFCTRILGPGTGQWPTGQPRDRLRGSSAGPQNWRSYSPQPSQRPSQNQSDQSSPQAADRGTSPTPTPTPTPNPRSAQASPSPGGLR